MPIHTKKSHHGENKAMPPSVQRLRADGKCWGQTSRLRMQEVKHMLLSVLLSLKKGKKTPAKAEAVFKYASAYEKLFKREKFVLYMQDSFDRLTNALAEDVENASSNHQKRRMLFVLQRVREKMEHIMDEEFGEVVDE